MIGKYEMILSAEEAFARQVALGVIVTRPLTVWHYLIPFMFIFDFLRRGSVVRSYTRHFMFPRKLAIEAAQDIIEGEDKEERFPRVEKEIKAWLDSLNLYSQALHGAQMKVVTLFEDHYAKLLQADADTYNALVRDAYNSRENFEAHLSQLTTLEKEVDLAIIDKLGESQKLREKLLAEQEQVEKQRKNRVAEIF